MKFAHVRSLALIACVLLISGTAAAQWRSGSLAYASPLDHSQRLERSLPALSLLPGGENVWNPDQSSILVSVFTGVNLNKNLGDFSSTCDCNFEGEFSYKNVGMLLGADITYVFHPSWAVMAKFMYDNKHTYESYDRTIDTPIKLENVVRVAPVQYTESADVSLSYFTSGLFLRWQPRLERWYLFAGPTAGLSIKSSIEHSQEIVTSELSYRENLDTKRVVSDDDITGKLRLEGMFGVGYDYIVRPRWFVSPEVRFGFPLSKVSDDDNWKTMSFQISVGLKYELY